MAPKTSAMSSSSSATREHWLRGRNLLAKLTVVSDPAVRERQQ